MIQLSLPYIAAGEIEAEWGGRSAGAGGGEGSGGGGGGGGGEDEGGDGKRERERNRNGKEMRHGIGNGLWLLPFLPACLPAGARIRAVSAVGSGSDGGVLIVTYPSGRAQRFFCLALCCCVAQFLCSNLEIGYSQV